MNSGARFAIPIALVAGGVLWTLTAATDGRAEPWDSGVYWAAAYPIAIWLAALLGLAWLAARLRLRLGGA